VPFEYDFEFHARLHQRLLTAGCPRPLLLEGGLATGEEGPGFGEGLFGACAMALEFLIQGLKCLSLGLQRVGTVKNARVATPTEARRGTSLPPSATDGKR